MSETPLVKVNVASLNKQPKRAPLCNADTRTIPGGLSLGSVVRSHSEEVLATVPPLVRPLSAPVLHSTVQLRQAIQQRQLANLNLTAKVEEKASSPTTAQRIKKKATERLNYGEDSSAFTGLMNTSVCETAVKNKLQQQLINKDNAVQPAVRPRFAAPSVSDWYFPEQYVSSVPHSSLHDTQLPFSGPRVIRREAVDRLFPRTEVTL